MRQCVVILCTDCTHAFLDQQSHTQTHKLNEVVDRTRRHFLRLDSTKRPGKQAERVPVIGIHGRFEWIDKRQMTGAESPISTQS